MTDPLSLHSEELLILTKTYPEPSAKHRETTCVAAINREGQMRRLYPIPFRLLDDQGQFQKWEWVQAQIRKAVGDNRPESYRVQTDNLRRTREKIDTSHHWAERKRWIEPLIDGDAQTLFEQYGPARRTLGFLRPTRLVRLDITPVHDTEWSEKDRAKLVQEGLFDSEEVRSRLPLEKLGHDFHYVYECASGGKIAQFRHKITDWEAGESYRKWRYHYGADWEKFFRQRYETEFAQKDLILMMGTIHRFPEQWLIIGLIYPPKPASPDPAQGALDL